MAKQTLLIGDNGTQLVSKFNHNFTELLGNYFNVESYGAVHDGITDDTEAIQATITACDSDGGGIIYFPKGIYVIGGSLVGTTGGATYNSQLIVPFVDNNNETRKTFHFLGEVVPNMSQSSGIVSGGVTHTTPSTGVILKSTITGSGTNPSVICGGLYEGGNYIWAEGNANQVIIENIQIHPVVDGSNRLTIGALNLRGCIDAIVKNVACYPFNFNVADTGIPQNNCVGIAMPSPGCGNHQILDNVTVAGFETGYRISEHTSLRDTVAICCLYGYTCYNAGHAIYAARSGAYWCATSLNFAGTYCMVKFNDLIEEQVVDSKWFDHVNTILDTNNIAHGEVKYSSTRSGVSDFYNPYYNKTGGANLQDQPLNFELAASFTVTGARDDGTALADLLAKLEAKGIIIDDTTAS